ncbi:carbohydrate esterase family 4 protein [Phaffia rhodozyma]|uniref:Carbohydrate esterase family 4 protein n=1 Tax=Phaffia rhodozyma TaxID=264483 RepID=A0A0F7SKM0_PHARH|nr:carbohydrate esterase family 4 protein [Phaffia rhodozyma]
MKSLFPSLLLTSSLSILLSFVVNAQDDGAITAGAAPAEAIKAYSCDPASCKLPDCACASTSPPGGLQPKDTPMFIVFTADDALQSYTIDAVNSLLQKRTNPNGCSPKMTYYTQISYTNFSMVTEWYGLGNEIADHTMTHIELAGADEINGNLIALNALAGIPLADIKGFRAPYLNYSAGLLNQLAQSGFLYDSSATSSSPVSDPDTDAFWPYTLDHGLLNDCNTFEDICFGKPQLPGFWEIPMYALFDSSGNANNIHLMDPWLDNSDPAFTLKFMKETFTAHYNGNRQPFGLYTHPIHLSTTYPGLSSPAALVSMINEFLDWAQEQENVWIVSSEQLLAWVRDPKSITDLGQSDALKCQNVTLPAGTNICNGLPGYDSSLLARCSFSDFPFSTCYGCPKSQPSVSDPNPEQVPVGGSGLRHRLPSNCSTACWDPIGNTCVSGSDCLFEDTSRPIGPNGSELTGGGTDSPSSTLDSSAPAATATKIYVPFSNNASPIAKLSNQKFIVEVLVALIGAVTTFM